jgi:tRNA A-37 threonylcarbamoyl transferase component Bud32
MRLLDESRRVESLSELSSLVSDTLAGSLHPSSALVWYRDPRERMDTASSKPNLSAADFPAGEEFSMRLERQGTVSSLPALENAGLAPEAVHWLRQRRIEVVVPLTDAADRLVGALFLGGKKSEEPYDRKDSQLLDAVAKQMAIFRENLHLRERLSEEVRVRHDVLSRLDDRLPDLLKECPGCGRCFEGSVQRCPNDNQPLVLTLPVARTVDGRYRLDRLLGKGGMGAVYEAEDLRLARRVAIKLMLSKGIHQVGALRRFNREARAAARLSHANIVTVYDFGLVDGELAYIVMQKVRGETLRAVLDRDGTLTLAEAREWFEPMLAGLAAAHANGIVHRDLKPENVMGDRGDRGDGDALSVKILDLGLAKLRATEQQAFETRTQEGLVMGTPSYMSPEQLAGNEVDQRSDIFAVGVMLLEALAGQRARSDDIRSGYALRTEFPSSGLPGALRGLLASCLAADPDDRPASAAALSGRLLPLLSTQD